MLKGLLAAVLAAVAFSGPVAVEAKAAPTSAATPDAGTYDLVFEKGNRRCRLFLRSEPRGDAFALAMTSVCRKAFPMLAGASAWTAGAGERIAFRGEAGQTLMDFAPDGSGSLATTVAGGDNYLLTPISPAEQERLRAAAAPAPDAAIAAGSANASGEGVLVSRTPAGRPGKEAAAEAAAMLPPATASEVAGNYAVLRQDRDTGCMVSLEPAVKAGTQRARLAPACRDQGIVIFDPAGWKIVGGTELVLTAKRGHSTALKRQNATTWANAPARGAPLVLKRL